jgi:hypothetical protein
VWLGVSVGVGVTVAAAAPVESVPNEELVLRRSFARSSHAGVRTAPMEATVPSPKRRNVRREPNITNSPSSAASSISPGDVAVICTELVVMPECTPGRAGNLGYHVVLASIGRAALGDLWIEDVLSGVIIPDFV